MAVDSLDKRASCLAWTPGAFPVPDSYITALDRQHVAGLYRGIHAGPLISKDRRLPPLNRFSGRRFDIMGDSEGLLRSVIRQLDFMARAMDENNEYGLQKFSSEEGVPSVGDMENGQIFFCKDGSTWKLYTKIGGTLFSAPLTEE